MKKLEKRDAILLAVMGFESHGGVADQITNLALHCPHHKTRPLVLVRNPLVGNHTYASILKQNGVTIWAIRERQYRIVRLIGQLFLYLLWPAILMDAAFRQKTFLQSRKSAWAVLRRSGYAGLDLIFLLRLIHAKILYRIKIIHFRKPDGWRWLAHAKRLGYCTIYTEDTIPTVATRHYYEGLAQVQKKVDCFTAVSQASADALIAFLEPDTSIKVIPNMVEPPPKDVVRKPDSFFHIASIARLAPPKDVATLITAVALLIPHHSNLRLHIYGDGPLRTQLEEQVKTLGVQEYVHFAGAFSKTDLPQVMSQTDVVVLSTHYEGFGVALVEGMAYGKPVIGTAVSGVTEVIDDNVTGFLAPPKTPEVVAQKIEQLMTNPQLYQRMSEAGRKKYLDNFTPEIVTQQYLNVYQSLCDATKKS